MVAKNTTVANHYGRISETPCFPGKIHRKSPQIVNYYGDSELVRRSIFNTTGSFGNRLCNVTVFGKSKRGLTNGGLSPKFSEKIGQKSFRKNRAFSGLIGAFPGPIGAFSGPIGTDSSAPHSHGGGSEIAPKGPFLAQLAPFGPSPRLLSPPFRFPRL